MKLAILLALFALSGIGKPYAGVQGTGATAPPLVSVEGGFPITATRNVGAGSATTFTLSSTVTTGGASFMVVAVSGHFTGACPLTISGGGLTWSVARSHTVAGTPYTNLRCSYVWTAPSASGLSNATITISQQASQTASYAAAIYSFTGASSVVGNVAGSTWDASAQHPQTTLNLGSVGSRFVVTGLHDDTTALTAVSGTTRDQHLEDASPFVNPAVGSATSATVTAGNVTAGFTGGSTNGYGAVAAVEIKP